jgi:addiction module RelE/StbE family toxin
MNVEWTANAIRQLSGIYEYISKDSEFYASRMIDRLTLRSIQIQEHALSGEMVPGFGDATIREVIEGPYRLIYQIDGSRLFVLAVIHGARILTIELLEDKG